MKLIALQAFSWAHRGTVVESFEKGQTIETEDPDLIEVSQREGWAEAGEGEGASGTTHSPTAKLTVAELKDALTQRGVEFAPDAKKAELQALYDQAQ